MADQTLASLTAATPATGGVFYGTQGGADRKFALSAAGAAVVEAATAGDQRTALGLGELATQDGIAVGGTATSGASAGDLLISDGSAVQKMTPGTGVGAALANAADGVGGLLTYGIIGTSGAAVPLLNAANQFANAQRFGNTSGDYLALGSSATQELRISSNAFSLGSGAYLMARYDDGDLVPATGATIYFEFNCGFRGNALFYSDIQWNDGTGISKYALDALMMRNWQAPTNACKLCIASTWSSSTNWEAGVIDWQTTANTLRIGSDVGGDGGTARDVQFIRGGAVKVTLGADATVHAQPVRLPSYTVSGLPSASTCGAGSMAFVTDATSTTAYTMVSGGGSSPVLVVSDGTNWIVH